MRAFLVLIVATAMALWWGGKNVLLALSERDPLEITCADYLKTKPGAQWLRLTHCVPDLDNMAIETKDDKATKVYIPLRPEGDGKDASKIVLERDDSDMLQIASAGENAQISDSVADRISAELEAPQEGLVSEPSSSDRNELAKLHLGLDTNFTIIERGNAPKLFLGILSLLGGLLGVGLVVRLVIRRANG